ncbi:MAG: type I DNA topoisomerase [Gammaproteobacteria bacterium]|nr:type I DNA topoisomerase [Gammaproteobacteria bacterium]
MSKNLILVESPAKGKTIEKYLGPDFKVLATYGHVRDLVSKTGAVTPDQGFSMNYAISEGSEQHLAKISAAIKKAETLYLATDLDREGEAIAWHVQEILKERNLLNNKKVHRVVFNAVTKRAVQNSINSPRTVSEPLVNAYKARRALDHLIGFHLSPLMWEKIAPKLSAGRVQSPALRLIVEREEQISAFKPREYWTIAAIAGHKDEVFRARLSKYGGKKTEQFTFTDEETVKQVEDAIKISANGILTVGKVEKKQRQRRPTAPFITSTLQQEASRKLGFTARQTMSTAQKLYEGIDVGGGSVGLITYMRTDSVTLAVESITEIRALIKDRYGQDNLPDEPRTYQTNTQNAQEAHEAIRPTSVSRIPADLEGKLNPDQYRLYDLIWKRTIASQMSNAIFDTVGLDLFLGKNREGDITFRATGQVLIKPGFMTVYQEGIDDKVNDENDRILPPLLEGDHLQLKEVSSEQHFTEPPPRYSEATLVKELEKCGIGRPSTYANIISTLRTREYVELENRRFTPTELGKVVSRFLSGNFPQYVDYEFTAKMEDDLDAISRGEGEWVPLLQEFWGPFHDQIEHIRSTVTRDDQARSLGDDPKTGRPMTVRMARFGPVVQIGTKDDEEKPLFAGLRPGQKMDTITHDEALELFKLPRDLGETADGETVSASIGRFGPYVRYGNKFVSIKEDDPYTIALPRAIELIEEKKIFDANRIIQDFTDAGIQVLNGRYGPYVTNKKKNAKIPKDIDPKQLSLEECQELIAAAPERKGRRGSKKAAGGKKTTTKKTTPKKSKKTRRKKTATKKP